MDSTLPASIPKLMSPFTQPWSARECRFGQKSDSLRLKRRRTSSSEGRTDETDSDIECHDSSGRFPTLLYPKGGIDDEGRDEKRIKVETEVDVSDPSFYSTERDFKLQFATTDRTATQFRLNPSCFVSDLRHKIITSCGLTNFQLTSSSPSSDVELCLKDSDILGSVVSSNEVIVVHMQDRHDPVPHNGATSGIITLSCGKPIDPRVRITPPKLSHGQTRPPNPMSPSSDVSESEDGIDTALEGSATMLSPHDSSCQCATCTDPQHSEDPQNINLAEDRSTSVTSTPEKQAGYSSPLQPPLRIHQFRPIYIPTHYDYVIMQPLQHTLALLHSILVAQARKPRYKVVVSTITPEASHALSRLLRNTKGTAFGTFVDNDEAVLIKSHQDPVPERFNMLIVLGAPRYQQWAETIVDQMLAVKSKSDIIFITNPFERRFSSSGGPGVSLGLTLNWRLQSAIAEYSHEIVAESLLNLSYSVRKAASVSTSKATFGIGAGNRKFQAILDEMWKV